MGAESYFPYRFSSGLLQVEIHRTRLELGRAAGVAIAGHLRQLLRRQAHVRAIFACAPSQNEFLMTLRSQLGIAWQRLTIFHMDEYVGIPGTHQASFRSYLHEHLTSHITPEKVYELAGDAADMSAECNRYTSLLQQAPIDIVCLGVGENGHLAFNDPSVADFRDPCAVKVVPLDGTCRKQQINDGCFDALDLVPSYALTLTLPTLLAGARLFCIVPGLRKAAAVKATLLGPVSTACPASILRHHQSTTLYLDSDSASLLPD